LDEGNRLIASLLTVYTKWRREREIIKRERKERKEKSIERMDRKKV
jgi:hypothetical protein